MKTYLAKTGEVAQSWLLVDAKGKILGRLAAKIAPILQGKHRPTYTPHVDTGDFVVVINARDIAVTGNKLEDKTYQRYSGYPGGLKEENMAHLLARKPAEVVRFAVQRMLPKNKLGRAMLRKLKVYAGDEHPHQAQHPQLLEI